MLLTNEKCLIVTSLLLCSWQHDPSPVGGKWERKRANVAQEMSKARIMDRERDTCLETAAKSS